MKRPPIDLSAREAHFLDHLAPVWREIPDEWRGTAYVGGPDVVEHARRLGIPAVEGWPERGPKLGPIVVASWGDLRVCTRTRRRLVLFEHGAGQSYGARHPSYVGGRGRERVALFVVPNAQAANRNLRYYPTTPNAVVGCPKLDELLTLPAPTAPTTAAVSFHWRGTVAPETGSAIDDFAPELATARAELEREGVELIGHAHPRIADEARELYAAAGIEHVADFAAVVERAHVYAVDNSSTLFEFAALGRPVVVLNARAYRRSVDFGLRFWTEAGVGLNAGPGELAATFLAALEDPDDVARSRTETVDRVYPVRDGTSALRAASAIVNLVAPGRTCLVCGAAHASCGGPTDVVPIDQRIKEKTRMGNLKRYPNPDRPGAFLRLSDEDAKRLGLLGKATREPARRATGADVTNPGGDAVVSSTTAAPPAEPVAPSGALRPSGVTRRARAAADAPETAAPTEPGDPDYPVADEPSPDDPAATTDPGPDAPDGDGDPAPAPDAPTTDDPKDKRRSAPSRRRKIADVDQA